jgi:hypothetical protein
MMNGGLTTPPIFPFRPQARIELEARSAPALTTRIRLSQFLIGVIREPGQPPAEEKLRTGFAPVNIRFGSVIKSIIDG